MDYRYEYKILFYEFGRKIESLDLNDIFLYSIKKVLFIKIS